MAPNITSLQVGDEVQWIDPESDGPHSIVEIQSSSGQVETEQTILILMDSTGKTSEAMACELG